MATRSLIGMELNNGITKIIYCHFDGYPEHNGQLLVNNYTSPFNVFYLLDLGDLRSLGESPASCIAYHRDQDEPWDRVEPRDINTSEIVSVGDDYGVDYIYIYKNECEWECLKSDGTPVKILAAVA